MALRKITLKNFKSIGEEAQTIELAPYTLLFGPNSAGKAPSCTLSCTSMSYCVTEPVIYLRQSWVVTLWTGGFLNVVPNRDPHRDIVSSRV